MKATTDHKVGLRMRIGRAYPAYVLLSWHCVLGKREKRCASSFHFQVVLCEGSEQMPRRKTCGYDEGSEQTPKVHDREYAVLIICTDKWPP